MIYVNPLMVKIVEWSNEVLIGQVRLGIIEHRINAADQVKEPGDCTAPLSAMIDAR
jgi:hypothetical protein